MKVKFLTVFLCSFLFAKSGFSKNLDIEPFSHDGCSLFLDGNPITSKSWKHCCIIHDVSYWMGGTKKQRKHADRELGICVDRATRSDKKLAYGLRRKIGLTLGKIMEIGVRIGGPPKYFSRVKNPAWYRWGYGWSENLGFEDTRNSYRSMITSGLSDLLGWIERADVNSSWGLKEEQSREIWQHVDQTLENFELN